ncbi:HNH endonuclease [Paenibacillus xylanexedens]|uniref:HNH endonuclease n=1 Tax=Paenibacillus xylanexedens TaxID=528191 RepID=UPI00119D8DBD|nr:HNH endonuclease [Paenibacillus xylanexedens]
MRYFLVFQNKSYKEEKKGEFLWAPKANIEGQTFHHWNSMTLVSKGDVIFNSFNGELLSIIVANNGFKESSKPADLAEVDLWENDGWKVDARYVQVDKPIRYKDYMDDILALQGEKYAPFNSLGRGNTGYLFQVTDQLADYLFSLLELKLEDVVAVEKSEDELIEAEIIAVSDEPEETVREQVVKNRIGQGIFKQRLRALEEKCKLCGIDNPNLLRASHTKPWSVSDNKERLDQYNGFLLCPAHDILFDKGLISFRDDGFILVSPLLEAHNKILMNVHEEMKVNLLEGHKVYLEYHRERIFKSQ